MEAKAALAHQKADDRNSKGGQTHHRQHLAVETIGVAKVVIGLM